MPEIHPNPWMVAPFIALLVAMALAPLYFADWWGRHFGKVAFGLAVITLTYYLIDLQAPKRVLETASEYFSFICLIGSLFVISGGIHINVKGEATPAANVVFLMIGTLAANILGNSGASILLIRPWLRMNKHRLNAYHVVFFIFIISNVGGCLTPMGPPLFLGFLRGIPFWWVAANCWPMWLTGMAVLLATFFVLDTLNFRRAPKIVRTVETAHEEWRFEGLGNLVFLGVVLGAVFIKHPPFAREIIMLLASIGSYSSTKKPVHEANQFNFHPLSEVAILFAGIFATMMPALDWLQSNAARFGTPGPGLFFWGSGGLSSVLDNAPTYLSFLSAELGAFATPEATTAIVEYIKAHGADLTAASGPYQEQICQAVAALQTSFPRELLTGRINPEHVQIALLLGTPSCATCLKALSVGSVFFGANTYIGNGPNFMVKAIADHQKAHTPTFIGYIVRFTLPFMLPMLLIVYWVFFR